jgi:hypothetical protein
MERINFIHHKGQEILFLNFSRCRTEEVAPLIDRAKKVIATRPEQSLLTLTDVTDMRFDDAVSQRMKEFTAHNKPYVRAAAVVGVTGIKKILFEAVVLFTKRKLHTFETVDQAKDWLATN